MPLMPCFKQRASAHKYASTLLLALLLAPDAGLSASSAIGESQGHRSQPLNELEGRVKLVTRSPQVVLMRDVVGSYQEHSAVFRELMRYATQRFPGLTISLFGIYPDDPDVLGETHAHWSLGMVISQGDDANRFGTVEGHFRIAVSPSTQAVELESTLANSRKDGLLLNAWLALSGYVQTAPTRIDYLEISGSPNTRIRISIPVSKRLSLEAKS